MIYLAGIERMFALAKRDLAVARRPSEVCFEKSAFVNDQSQLKRIWRLAIWEYF